MKNIRTIGDQCDSRTGYLSNTCFRDYYLNETAIMETTKPVNKCNRYRWGLNSGSPTYNAKLRIACRVKSNFTPISAVSAEGIQRFHPHCSLRRKQCCGVSGPCVLM